MKKIISVMLCVVIALCSFTAVNAFAATPWENDKQTNKIYWNEKFGDYEFLQVSAENVCITKYHGNSENISVPNKINGYNVTQIGDNAFGSNKTVKKITLPKGIVEIGLGAFENCENLSYVSIGTSVRKIGFNAFYNTKVYNDKMKSKNIAYIGKYLVACDSDKYGKKLTVKDGTIGIADNAIMPSIVSSNGKLKTVTLPNSIRFVGNNAFSDSKNIVNIKLADKLERIGKNAFKGTKFYKNNVKTYSGAKYIGKYLCEGVSSAKSVKVKNKTTVIADGAFVFGDKGSKIRSITFSSSLKTIGDEAFENSKYLKSVSVTKNVKYIGSKAFLGCKNLERFKVDKNNKKYLSKSGVLFDKNKTAVVAYPSSDSSTTFSVPNSVKYIEAYAFYGARNLSSVKLNNGLVFIGELAFANCSKFDSVTVPNSVRRICSMAFGAVSDGEKSYKSKKFIVYGSADSAAKRYCESHEIDNQSYHSPNFVLV